MMGGISGNYSRETRSCGTKEWSNVRVVVDRQNGRDDGDRNSVKEFDLSESGWVVEP